MGEEAFDYVVVGGGSAGCVLANRLSADSSARVLLLEAGGRDWHPFIHMPVGFAKLTDSGHTWGFKTAPQKHAEGREIPYAQGRVVGGSSSINAEVFTRGHPSDYDRWAREEGCEGWAFQDIRHCFLRSEGNEVFSDAWHGAEGPLGVSNLAPPQPMTLAFVRACQEFGIPFNPDFNGPRQAGCAPYQVTVRNRRRCSAAAAYLRPVLRRRNLTLRVKARAERLRVEGRRVVGVSYECGGKRHEVRAEREVLVAAGAVGTPKLMMLSGFGPAEHLNALGIEVIENLPGVGSNLTDHFGIDIVAELNGHYSLDKYNKWHWAAWAAAQYVLFGSGPAASNVVEGGAFWFSGRPDAGELDEMFLNAGAQPDLQFHFLAGAGAEAGVPSVPAGSSGITLNSYTLRPKARGTVRLRSADPAEPPVIDPNFLGHPDDVKVSAEGVRISREIFAQPSLQKYIRMVRFPDEAVKTQADFEDYARRYGRTSYHPTCTCKMGVDEMAVVDPQLRVRGVEGVRICDSSVMPSLIGSNTNAATLMIAERGSDLIRGG